MERWALLLVAKFISLINEAKISDTFLYLSSYPSPHVLMMMPQECTTPQEGGIFNKILLATRYSVLEVELCLQYTLFSLRLHVGLVVIPLP